MNPIIKRLLFSGILLLVAGILLWLRLDTGSGSTGPNAPVAEESPDRVRVAGYVVRPEEFSETIRTTGNILADEEVYIRPEVSGRITRIHFEEDSEVEEGDLLVKLNDAELQQEKRRISYQINLARIRERRQQELLDRNAIAQEDYDIALNELNTLIAQEDGIQARIDQTEIRAPFDGIVGLKEISVGSYVSPDAVISSLQKIDPLKIEFSIPERYRASITRGQTVRFSVEGLDNNREGEVYAIQPRVDRETRTLRIRAIAPNPGLLIFPGAYARVQVDLRSVNDALLIPSEALIPELSGYHVLVYSGGRAVERPVQIGTRTDRQIVIREGLAPGDTVITTGLLQIRDGMPVSIEESRTEIPVEEVGAL